MRLVLSSLRWKRHGDNRGASCKRASVRRGFQLQGKLFLSRVTRAQPPERARVHSFGNCATRRADRDLPPYTPRVILYGGQWGR